MLVWIAVAMAEVILMRRIIVIEACSLMRIVRMLYGIMNGLGMLVAEVMVNLFVFIVVVVVAVL